MEIDLQWYYWYRVVNFEIVKDYYSGLSVSTGVHYWNEASHLRKPESVPLDHVKSSSLSQILLILYRSMLSTLVPSHPKMVPCKLTYPINPLLGASSMYVLYSFIECVHFHRAILKWLASSRNQRNAAVHSASLQAQPSLMCFGRTAYTRKSLWCRLRRNPPNKRANWENYLVSWNAWVRFTHFENMSCS